MVTTRVNRMLAPCEDCGEYVEYDQDKWLIKKFSIQCGDCWSAQREIDEEEASNADND